MRDLGRNTILFENCSQQKRAIQRTAATRDQRGAGTLHHPRIRLEGDLVADKLEGCLRCAQGLRQGLHVNKSYRAA